LIHLLTNLIDETALRHNLTGGNLLRFAMLCCCVVQLLYMSSFLYHCISWVFQVYLIRAILALIEEALYDLWLVVLSAALALANALRSAFVVLIKWTGYIYRVTIKCFTCEAQPSVARETTPLLRSEPKHCEDQMPRYFLDGWSSFIMILLECYSPESSDEDLSDVENLLNSDFEASIFIKFNAW